MIKRWVGILTLVATAMLLSGSSCDNGGNPGPQPTPEPTPDTSLLLRSANGQFVKHSDGSRFDWKGTYFCCYDEGGFTPSTGWPGLNNHGVDVAAAQGATVVQMRLGPYLSHTEPAWDFGPYVEVGGKADLNQFDQRWWDAHLNTVRYANSKGMVVVIDLIDGWYLKRAIWGHVLSPFRPDWNVQGEDVIGNLAISQPRIVSFLMKAIATFGAEYNIVWLDGNEIGLVPGLDIQAWTQGMRNLVRMHETVAHLFGTNGGPSAWGLDVDWAVDHNQGVAITPKYGKPTVINEYNPWPALTGEEIFTQYCRAQNMGSYFDVWRHGMSDAEYARAWELIRTGSCGEPSPPPVACPLNTPTASWLKAQGARVEVRPEIHGATVSATPLAAFGNDYYCQPEVNWPEACAEGRTFGPVAPEGHPNRLECEQQFLEQCGPVFSMAVCTGTPDQCPVTFDPFYVIGGVNQNHPSNVAAGCGGQFTDHESWVVVPGNGVVEGAMWASIAHGKGHIKACNGPKTVCTQSGFEIDR